MGYFRSCVCAEKQNRLENIRIRRYLKKGEIKKANRLIGFLWGLTGSNRRPSACKADALNQLS